MLDKNPHPPLSSACSSLNFRIQPAPPVYFLLLAGSSTPERYVFRIRQWPENQFAGQGYIPPKSNTWKRDFSCAPVTVNPTAFPCYPRSSSPRGKKLELFLSCPIEKKYTYGGKKNRGIFRSPDLFIPEHRRMRETGYFFFRGI